MLNSVCFGMKTEVNEMIAEYNSPQDPPADGGNDDPDGSDSANDNWGTRAGL